MPTPIDDLKERLVRYRQIKISVIGRKSGNTIDFHPEFQQIGSVDTDTGEFQEQRLAHREEAEKFYRGLAGCGPEGTCWNGSQRARSLV